jgi:nucleotide-binding universal stress UspA family protein
MCTDAAAAAGCDSPSASTRRGEVLHQRTQKIVVGVDGSAKCREAVRWAVEVRDAALADVRDREHVRIVALEGDAGRALVRESADADLLVGSHRAAPTSTTVLGSVSLYCTLHARCPVVVLPKTGARRSAMGPERALRSA